MTEEGLGWMDRVRGESSPVVHLIYQHAVHGMVMGETPYNDGSVGFSQGTLEMGKSYNYTFQATPAGLSFYHGHFMDTMASGNRGINVVRKRPCNNPYA